MSDAVPLPARRRRLTLGLGLGAVVAVIDQASKWAILEHFRPDGVVETPFYASGHVPVLPILDFVLAWNRGISFGLGNSPGPYNALLFTLLAAVIGVALVLWMARTPDRLVLSALGLVVGGALGNAVDRWHYGAVVDFLYVHIGSFNWWPAMNLADWAISLGAILLAYDSLFVKHEWHKNTP